MAERKFLCVTDPPVTGGAILPNGSTISLGDTLYPSAHIGDQASCQACGAIGTIIMTGGTHRMDMMGKLCALEGDLLDCKCAVKPPIISDKARARTYEDRGDTIASSSHNRCVENCMHLLGQNDPFPFFNCYNRCAGKVVRIDNAQTNG